MGFYGNITNTARTQFQFDRIYSNRYEMEISMSTDGVYAGRYVLIEYDQTPGGTEVYEELYLKNGKFYFGYEVSDATRVRYPQDLAFGEIVRVYTELPPATPDTVDKRQPAFYKCTGGNNENYATFEEITNSSIAQYTQNYSIDLAKYGDVGRGWDSTVWQKTYTNGVEKYVMIAELNTVVPTFDVVPDAPTLAPIAPHFDANSNNVYYQLHYQPQWGMRVRNADSLESSAGKDFPSDEVISWRRETYDVASDTESEVYYFENENKWRALEKNEAIPTHAAAIYYNKAGFDSETITHDSTTNNVISVEPTGISGNKYNTHNGISNDPTKPDKNEYAEAEDIQEITIMLPSIGNAIASLWDIIYGNEIQNEGTKRNHDIAWETAMDPERKGLRLVENNGNGFTYNTSRVNTLAGCINSIHDLMGMIIIDSQPQASETTYNDNKIYYYNNKYWRIHKTYIYTKITEDKFKIDGEYYYDVENGNFPRYGFWNNEVGYVDGLATREVSYEMQELEGFSRNFNTIHGLLLEIRKILETGDMLTRDQSTVQGSINVLNDIIAKFTKMTPTDVMIVDKLGRVHGAPQTTKQTFAYVNEGYQDNSKNGTKAESEDRWIYWNVDDNAENPLITLEHRFTKIENTTSTSDKNNDGANGTGNNKAHGDTIDLYTPIVDNMGHIVGKNIETVTLPYGFKTIKSTNNELVSAPTTTIKEVGQIADNTQDILNINASNRWIKIDNNTEDTIQLGHRLSNFESGEANTKYGLAVDTSVSNLDTDNTFEVPYFRFDEAGHIDFAETHTVTIPENFDKVVVTLSDTVNEDKLSGTVGTISADTLTDTLTLAEGNRWINIDANITDDKVTFSHYVKDFTQTISTQDFNDSDNNKTFTVQTIGWDRAGHLISSDKKTLTIPDGYKTVKIENGGVNTTTTSEGVGGNLVAESLVDTLNINTGNRWISLVADKDNDGFTIYHKFAGTVKENGSANLAKDNNVTPKFGEKFKVFTAGVDEAGHVNNLSDYEITLPKPSLNDLTATGSSVLTGISMVSETGAITQTNANVGTLTLSGYSQGTDQGDLVASDSINGAFAKLQNQMHAEESARTKAITDESAARSDADTTLTNNLNKEIKDRQDAITAEENARKTEDIVLTNSINKEIEDRKTAVSGEATARFEAIVAEQQARAQAINNAIAQEVTDRNSAISTAIGNVTGGSNETIAALLARIEALETKYTELLAKVEANHPVEEVPEEPVQ